MVVNLTDAYDAYGLGMSGGGRQYLLWTLPTPDGGSCFAGGLHHPEEEVVRV